MKSKRGVVLEWSLAILLLALGGAEAAAQSVDVALSVNEPSGVARTSQHVTCGVPIPLSAASGPFALYDGANQIPVQATVLPGVRTPWVLLDFRATVGANLTKQYQLKSVTPTATPTQPVVVTPGATEDQIVTGRIKVTIRKNTYNFLQAVWYDANNNGVFATSERLFNTTTGADNLPLTGGTNGPGGSPPSYSGKAAPTAFVWEEAGPLRATLRVEGVYGNATTPTLLRYRTRFTFQAGQNHVIVEHVLRNCVQLEERYVKVRSAQLRIGTTNYMTQVLRSGDRRWVNPDSASTSAAHSRLELVPAFYPLRDAAGAVTSKSVVSNGGIIVSDMSYHGATFCLDFTPSLTATDRANRTTAFQDRLMARAPEAWYSDQGAFASERFGTYQNEKDAYTRWNWAPNPNTNVDDEHSLPRPTPAFYPDWSVLHASSDPESDDLWQHLMMWARTGHQTYLDRADGWARHLMWQRCSRTDGFLYAWDDYWEGPVAPPLYVTRTLNWLPASSQSADDQTLRTYSVLPRKAAGSHMWNGGLVDYYYLTGNRDALNAARDLAEQADRFMSWRVVGQANHSPAHNIRAEARQYLCFLRVWEATDSTRWRAMADQSRDVILGSYWYDARGFWGTPTANLGLDQQGQSYGTRFPNGIYISPFGIGVTAVALYRDFVLTANAAAGARLETMADFAMQFGSDPLTGYTGDDMVIDSPSTGSILHMSYGQFRNTPGGPWTYSNEHACHNFIDILAIGWRRSGNYNRMLKAKDLWDKASKGPPNNRFSTTSQRGHFANSLQCCYYPSVDILLWRDGGDLTYVQTFLNEAGIADYVPPTTPNLYADVGRSTAVVLWNAPGDDGDLGQAIAYDLRWSNQPITEASFANATSLVTGVPGPPGHAECVDMMSLPACTHYYFAIKVADDVGNWTPMSNVPDGITSCTGGGPEMICDGGFGARPAETDLPRFLEFATVSNGAAAGAVSLNYGIPPIHAGQPLEIDLFDIAGRRVQSLVRETARPGRFHVALRSPNGSGVFFARLRIGHETKSQKVIIAR